MLQEMSWREWWDWQAFAELEPFDEEREDIRNAHIVQTLVNINRDSKKRPTPYPIQDFILKIGDTPKYEKKQTWQEQKRIGRMYYEESLKKDTRITRPKAR